MNVKLRSVSLAALFFTGALLTAQKKSKDSISTVDIDEVIVVGYNKVKRSEFVGSASQIDTKSLDNKAVSNVTQALAGEAAGVRVINTSGQPGSDATIRIRGLGSVNGNRSPLIILDGMAYEGNMASINPDDIANISILKDATATAIYGARGANGVVLITTKRGRSGVSNIQIESKVGTNMSLLPRYKAIKSPETYIELAWEALYNKGVLIGNSDPTAYANSSLFGTGGISPSYNMWDVDGANLINASTGKVNDGVSRLYTPEKWEDYAFNPGIRTETNLSMSGGEGKTTYYTSFGYLKDEGYIINSDFQRYSTRINLGYQPKKWLNASFNLGYVFTKSTNNGQSSDSGSVFWFADNIPSIYPLYLRDSDGNKIVDPYFGGYQYDYGNENSRGFGLGTNAIADATYDRNRYQKHEMNANLNLDISITKDLSFETRIGGQYFNNTRSDFNNPYYGSAAQQGGSIYKVKAEMFTWNFLQLLRYKKRFGNHGVEAFAAHESNSWDTEYLTGSKSGLIDPNGDWLSNAITTSGLESYIYNYRLESFFGSLTYDFDNKYLLSASIRRDGSSRFKDADKRWDTFPSIGLGWVVSRENFLKDVALLPYLKLKTSYGLIGDQSLGSYYPGYNVYNAGNFMGLIGATFDRYGYPDLTWEKAKQFQVGAEFALLKNRRIEATVEYYNKKTDNLIFDRRTAPSTGMAIVKVNDGALVNQGVEFTVTGHIVKKSDFYVDLTVNGEILKNKLTKMPIDPSTGFPKVLDLAESGYGRAEGHSIYDFYMREWAGVNSQTGAAQWVVNYVDANGNGAFDSGEQISSLFEYMQANPDAVIAEGITETYSESTQKFIGKSAIPDLRGAVNLSIGYKGFSIGAQMLYSIGGYAYDGAYAGLMGNGVVGSSNWHTDILNRWQQAGDVTNVPRLSSANGQDANFTSQSTRFLTKADYFVLNNANIAYTFGKEILNGTGLNSLTLSVTGDNLWINSQRKGFNPSTSETGASDVYRYSPLSTLTFGVKANF